MSPTPLPSDTSAPAKETYLYARGTAAVTFEVNGLRFGLASGLEVLFGDIFPGYDDAGADAVLFSSQGLDVRRRPRAWPSPLRAAARQHGLTVGYSVPTSNAPFVAAGVIGPDGRWATTCRPEALPDVTTCDVTSRPEGGAREWRRSMVAAG